MDRDQLIEILPCYVCGDLPAEVMAMIEAQLTEDPDLQALVDGLRLSRETCTELLAESSPPELAWEAEDTPSSSAPERSSPRWLPIAVSLAAALLVGLFLFGRSQEPPPALVEAPSVEQPVAPPVEQPTAPEGLASLATRVDVSVAKSTDSWKASSEPADLSAHLQAVGLSPGLAMVADMREMGIELVGGARVGPGSVVVYRHPQGFEFSCLMVLDQPAELNAVTTLQPPPEHSDRPPLLTMPKGDSGLTVLWRENGMACVMSALDHGDALLAMAKTKIWGVVG